MDYSVVLRHSLLLETDAEDETEGGEEADSENESLGVREGDGRPESGAESVLIGAQPPFGALEGVHKQISSLWSCGSVDRIP